MGQSENSVDGVAGSDSALRIADIVYRHRDLYSGEARSMGLAELLKAEPLPIGTSGQAVSVGIKPRPFDMIAVAKLIYANEWHSACIKAKQAATVGLGHKDRNIHLTLNELCSDSGWQGVLNSENEDYWNVGTGYIEVVRHIKQADNPNPAITGLHWIPAVEVRVVIEDDLYNGHYEISSGEGNQKKFARYGELALLRKRLGNKTIRSEIIRFRQPTSLSRWYGYPDWLSAVIAIEIVQMLNQHTFDFFLNRCVPEFILFILGKKLSPPDWAKLEEVFKQNIGLGNSRKSTAFNFEGSPEEIQVQLEKLGIDQQGQGGFFTDFNDPLSLRIVTAHRVPPLLAGIQIAGKLGAANEMSNAMLAFQALVIGQAQESHSTTLGQTLGDPERNGGLGRKLGRGGSKPLGSTDEDEFEFNSIVDKISAGLIQAASQGDNAGGAKNPLNTNGRMRTETPVAVARGRDLTAGVKKADENGNPGE